MQAIDTKENLDQRTTKHQFVGTEQALVLNQHAPLVVAVLGAKGGVGATTVTVNVAAALSANRRSTTIIDANLQQPDVAHLIGCEPRHSLMELLTREADMDRKLFEAIAIEIAGSHLNLLSPPLNGEAAVKTNLTSLTRCIRTMQSFSEVWVIDLPRHLDKHLVTLADMCDKIILVFEATVSGVAACRYWLETFYELGYQQDQIICLLNRAGSKYKGVEQQLGDHFGDEPIFRLPNAFGVNWECSTRGVPIVLAYPNHPYSKAIYKMANYISKSNSQR